MLLRSEARIQTETIQTRIQAHQHLLVMVFPYKEILQGRIYMTEVKNFMYQENWKPLSSQYQLNVAITTRLFIMVSTERMALSMGCHAT